MLAKTEVRSYHSCSVSKTLQGRPVSLRFPFQGFQAFQSCPTPSLCWFFLLLPLLLLLHSCIGLLAVPHVHQARSCPWAFPLAVPSGWNALHLRIGMAASSPSGLIQKSVEGSSLTTLPELHSLQFLYPSYFTLSFFFGITVIWHIILMFLCLVSVSTLPPRM